MKMRTYVQIANDIDAQQDRADAIGNALHRMKQQGMCDHGSLQGNKQNSSQVCRQCGEVFATFEDAAAASYDAITNFRKGE